MILDLLGQHIHENMGKHDAFLTEQRELNLNARARENDAFSMWTASNVEGRRRKESSMAWASSAIDAIHEMLTKAEYVIMPEKGNPSSTRIFGASHDFILKVEVSEDGDVWLDVESENNGAGEKIFFDKVKQAALVDSMMGMIKEIQGQPV